MRTILHCRLITRAVLIPFITGEECMQLQPSVRARVDGELQRAISKANMAAGVLIGLGNTLKHTQDEAHLLMDKVAEAVGMAMQRVYVSYGWLVHATFKVGITQLLSKVL